MYRRPCFTLGGCPHSFAQKPQRDKNRHEVTPSRYPPPVHRSHLVIQRQVAERWDVLGPFHQDQQLLLHGLTHVCDGGDLLGPDVAVQRGSGRRDLRDTCTTVSCARSNTTLVHESSRGWCRSRSIFVSMVTRFFWFMCVNVFLGSKSASTGGPPGSPHHLYWSEWAEPGGGGWWLTCRDRTSAWMRTLMEGKLLSS